MMAPAGPSASWPSRRYAWYVLILMTIAYALAILDRVAFALMIDPMQASLGLTDTQFGLLQGLAFSFVSALVGLPIGMFSDRSRRVLILGVGVLLRSLATILCAFGSTFEELFIARMLVGIGEAALIPVATSLVADYFAPQDRPRAYSVLVMGTTLGSAVAMALSGTFLFWSEGLIANYQQLFGGMAPWQVVFLLCGFPGLVLVALWTLTVREPVRQGEGAGGAGIFSLKPILGLFGAHPMAFASLLVGSVLNLVCIYAIVGWIPAFFIRVHGWSGAETGWLLGIVGMPISLVAALGSGFAIGWLARRGRSDAPLLIAAVSAIAMLTLGTAMSLAPSGLLSLAAYAAIALFANWNIAGVYSGVAQITPNTLRAQVMAIQTIVTGLVAITAGNFIVGFLTDRVFSGSSGIAYSLAVVFTAFGGGALILLLAGCRAFRAATADNQTQQPS